MHFLSFCGSWFYYWSLLSYKRVCAGMWMHVSCVIMKDDERANLSEIHYKKRAYLTFTGKAKQDQGAVMAIYQSAWSNSNKIFLTWNPLLINWQCWMLPQWGSVCLESPLASIKFNLEVFTNSLKWKAVR